MGIVIEIVGSFVGVGVGVIFVSCFIGFGVLVG